MVKRAEEVFADLEQELCGNIGFMKCSRSTVIDYPYAGNIHLLIDGMKEYAEKVRLVNTGGADHEELVCFIKDHFKFIIRHDTVSAGPGVVEGEEVKSRLLRETREDLVYLKPRSVDYVSELRTFVFKGNQLDPEGGVPTYYHFSFSLDGCCYLKETGKGFCD